MHSGSRLTYEIPAFDANQDEPKNKRFVAEVAIDDLAAGGGSVIFRVLLDKDGNWQNVFSSPIVRSGDQSLAVEVELGEARQIALVVELADRGDELDHANWLDARFE